MRPAYDEAVLTPALKLVTKAHPAWAKRGIGRAIYRLCESGARAAGATTLECYSTLNGEAFYAALGFESIGPIEVELVPNVMLPSILMRRKI